MHCEGWAFTVDNNMLNYMHNMEVETSFCLTHPLAMVVVPNLSITIIFPHMLSDWTPINNDGTICGIT